MSQRPFSASAAISGETPAGSPDGLLPVTKRKLPILIAARRTPVGASSDTTSRGMGNVSDNGERFQLILNATTRHANFRVADGPRDASICSRGIIGFAKRRDRAFAGCGASPARQEGTADGTLRTRKEDSKPLRERQPRDQGEPRPYPLAGQA